MTPATWPTYGEYVPSNISWCDELPAHWDRQPVRSLFNESRARNGKRDGYYLSLMAGTGVIPYDEKGAVGNKKSDDLSNCKVVDVGDFVINSMNFGIGSFGRSAYQGVCSSVYVILKSKYPYLSKYLERIFQHPTFQASSQSLGNGILAHRCAIGWEEMKNAHLPVPPKSEAIAIAAFLDDKCAKVDEAVRIKEEQIALLRERRQILIQEAVTRGLNPDAPMKDTGVGWIGHIPMHWNVKRLKYLLSEPLKYGANEEAGECVPGDPRYIRITDFGLGGKLRDDTWRTLPWKIASDYLLESGDILLARSGATVGKAYNFDGNIKACFAGYLIRARADRRKLLPEFLFYFLRSPAFERWKEVVFSKATIQNIGADKYASLALPVPGLGEQSALLRHLDDNEAKVEGAISIKKSQIAHLREYKTTLINAAVTGKIKVA